MAKFSITSIAIKWHFFSYSSSVNIFGEYFNLFMKQLGFNPAQIGFTTLLGLPSLLIPLCVLLGEKFRAMKTVLVILAVGLSVCCVLPLLSLIVPALQPKCYSKTSIDSINPTQQAVFRNAPVHLKYANNRNNLKRSVIFPKNKIHLSRSNMAMPRLNQKFRVRNGSIHANDASKQPSDFKNNVSLHNLTIPTPRNTSSHSTNSSDATYFRIHHPQPWISALFLILLLSRSQLVLLESTDIALANLATMTYLKDENASYGAYYMWSNVGTALSICFAAGLAWFIRIFICGVEEYGYFIAFIWGSVISLQSVLSLPWFKFEYNEKKSYNWPGVKSDIFNAHYMFMFILLFFTGLCLSFQIYWEFWFFDGLFASPLLFAGAIMIRRPLVAMSTLASGYLIKKIGDLKTVCLALFLYAVSFLALSFAQMAWLVVLIDTFQAVANGISYCAFTVLFYNASSTENSSFILGLQETVYSVAYEAGGTLTGVLFHILGTKLALRIYSMSSAVLLITLLLYIRLGKYDHYYQKVAQDIDKE